MKVKRRWSDNQKQLWPFTVAKETGKWNWSVVIDSGYGEYPGCHLRLRGFGWTLIIELPQIIRPWRKYVDLSPYAWADAQHPGYWDEHAREYGFSYSQGFLQVFLGPQTHDSTTTKDWTCFLPWTEWRFYRFSLYDLQGKHFWTQYYRTGKFRDYEEQRKHEEICPSRTFQFLDYDGEQIEVVTRIEEREWLFGTGYFKWLSLFRKAKVNQCLLLNFSKETGHKKGSWKGGTVGHSIELFPNELHESGFKRYCAEHEMVFLGEVK